MANLDKFQYKQQLRILTQGVKGEDDWRVADYLIKNDYAKGDTLLSTGRNNYGEIIELIWEGPTDKGLEYVDELKRKIKS